jgi:hypothetical protein
MSESPRMLKAIARMPATLRQAPSTDSDLQSLELLQGSNM